MSSFLIIFGELWQSMRSGMQLRWNWMVDDLLSMCPIVAGETPKQVPWWYGIPEQAVVDSAYFEQTYLDKKAVVARESRRATHPLIGVMLTTRPIKPSTTMVDACIHIRCVSITS